MIIRSAIVTLAILLMPAAAQAGPVSFKSDSEQQVIALLNQIRAQHHLSPLEFSAPLRGSARSHSGDMVRRGYFSHDAHGEGAHARILSYLKSATNGENIGWGTGILGSADGIVYQWMHHASHRAVILDPEMHQVGLGMAIGTFQGRPNAVLATADFAS